jgi:hypothetical protein
MRIGGLQVHVVATELIELSPPRRHGISYRGGYCTSRGSSALAAALVKAAIPLIGFHHGMG